MPVFHITFIPPGETPSTSRSLPFEIPDAALAGKSFRFEYEGKDIHAIEYTDPEGRKPHEAVDENDALYLSVLLKLAEPDTVPRLARYAEHCCMEVQSALARYRERLVREQALGLTSLASGKKEICLQTVAQGINFQIKFIAPGRGPTPEPALPGFRDHPDIKQMEIEDSALAGHIFGFQLSGGELAIEPLDALGRIAVNPSQIFRKKPGLRGQLLRRVEKDDALQVMAERLGWPARKRILVAIQNQLSRSKSKNPRLSIVRNTGEQKASAAPEPI